MNTRLITAVTVVLALLMWYSHADIFQRLEIYNGKELTWPLMALNTCLALGFSALTAISVRYIEEYKWVALFGTFDGIAIFLHFQSNIDPYIFNWIGSIFCGCLMFFEVSMVYKLSEILRREKPEAEQSKAEATKPAPMPAEAVQQPETIVQQPETTVQQPETIVQQTVIVVEDAYKKAIRAINAYRGNLEKIQAFYNSIDDEGIKAKIKWTVGHKYNLR